MNEQSRFMRWGERLFTLAMFLGVIGLALVAIAKVRSGEGHDTYRTVWLYEFSYVGLLIFFGAILVAGMVGFFFFWREHRLEKDFLRKYGAKEP